MALMDSMGLSELSHNENNMSVETDPTAPPKPKRMKITADEFYDKPYVGPRNLPEMLVGEVTKLPFRYKVDLDQSNFITSSDNIMSKSQLQQKESQDILLNCQIRESSSNDTQKYNPLPIIDVLIPCDYPSSAKKPRVSETCWSDDSLNKYYNGNIAKINLTKNIKQEFEKRVENSNYKTLTQLLGILENSIKQVCCN